MARIIWQRDDAILSLTRGESAGVHVSLAAGLSERVELFSAEMADYEPSAWRQQPLPGGDGLVDALAGWVSRRQEPDSDARTTGGDRRRVRRRLCIDAPHPLLVVLPWEEWLGMKLRDRQVVSPVIMRYSVVAPRTMSIPLSLPLRIVQLGLSSDFDVRAAIKRVFQSYDEATTRLAVRTERLGVDEIEGWREQEGGVSIEVVHLEHATLAAFPSAVGGTGVATIAGSSAWLKRFSTSARVRLVVMTPSDEAREIACLRAAELVGSGGPAVLVAPADNPEWLNVFYDFLIHDTPLDIARARTVAASGGESAVLFGGGGREETLRVSTVGAGLMEIQAQLVAAPTPEGVTAASLRTLAERMVAARERLPRKPSAIPADHPQHGRSEGPPASPSSELGGVLDPLRPELANYAKDWPYLEFDQAEGGGLLPTAHRLEEMRKAAGLDQPLPLPKKSAHRKRFVNSRLWHQIHSSPAPLRQEDSILVVGETYWLDVQIGVRDQSMEVIGAEAILEERFGWTTSKDGVWLQVAVTGIDFDLVGSPVQELWLPRDRDSEAVRFAIIPRATGAALLRFTLFHEDTIVQSFRLAARTRDAHQELAVTKDTSRELAALLSVSSHRVGVKGYLSRLEFSQVSSLGSASALPAVALSIVANDIAGRSVISVKSGEAFEVRTNLDALPYSVARAREQLQCISRTDDSTNSDLLSRPYAFGFNGKPNAGAPDVFQRAMKALASTGWTLFDQVFPPGVHAAMQSRLEKPGQVIAVAQIMIDKVIPWAAVYDRYYDADKEEDGSGTPVAHEACTVPIPDVTSAETTQACGTHAHCPLHPARMAARTDGKTVMPETVACPRHFWGFKHIIELPPQQVASELKTRDRRVQVKVDGIPRVVAGAHAGIGITTRHLSDLEQLCREVTPKAEWGMPAYQRDEVLRVMQQGDFDVIYLFCHARGGTINGVFSPPQLEVMRVGDPKAGVIQASQIPSESPWSHAPLAILNGCGTLAFAPDALSPFITKLLEDLGAAGLLGTEIPVYDVFAAEMGATFLARFLKGMSAGESLLLARRSLLAQGNPLGLAYTLHAAAELSLTS